MPVHLRMVRGFLFLLDQNRIPIWQDFAIFIFPRYAPMVQGILGFPIAALLGQVKQAAVLVVEEMPIGASFKKHFHNICLASCRGLEKSALALEMFFNIRTYIRNATTSRKEATARTYVRTYVLLLAAGSLKAYVRTQ